MPDIENRTFDEIQIGDTARLRRTLSREDILLFAAMSGDVNPAHVDEEFARSDVFHEIIAHGMWGAALISTVLGTQLPGPGAIYIGQTLRFRRPVAVGDQIGVIVSAKLKDEERKRIVFACECVNAEGETVISGEAEVLAPTKKVRRARAVLPEVRLLDRHARYLRLMQLVEPLPPIRVAVVHPVDRLTLAGVAEAASTGVIEPILIGPGARVQMAAESAHVDLGDFECIDVSHSRAAANDAVSLAAAGRIDAIMKGTLGTDELMEAIGREPHGLRTGRAMTHVYVLDVPSFPRPLLLTDAGLHVFPTLEQKRDIVQNAIDLARVMQIETPKVGILAAVGRVDPKMPSTIDAAVLCKMAERGQITGAIVDGPLAFDSAVSGEAARRQHVLSPVAGQADILIVPDLETGHMLVKQLEYLADTSAVGLVLGARVPVILPMSESTPRGHAAGGAVAALLVDAHRQRPKGEPPQLRDAPLP
ncbi:MAG: bifunctional enoyl-CoA hydratase/phosphate acetyltransferase [Gammaproteobacteria bacterium]